MFNRGVNLTAVANRASAPALFGSFNVPQNAKVPGRAETNCTRFGYECGLRKFYVVLMQRTSNTQMNAGSLGAEQIRREAPLEMELLPMASGHDVSALDQKARGHLCSSGA